jgi:insulysin
LSAGEGERSYAFSLFSTSIKLTDAGQGTSQFWMICELFYLLILSFISCGLTEHVDEVVGLVFKYIKLLRDSGVQKWIFDEVL